MNHQPCNQVGTGYLRLSTQMSKDLSLARVSLEGANVALEDVLILELDERPVDGMFELVVEALEATTAELNGMLLTIAELRGAMKKHHFADLPTLKSTRLGELGLALSSKGMVRRGSWEVVSSAMQNGGFFSVLDLFDKEVQVLVDIIENLQQAMSKNIEMASHGKLNLVLEQNQPGNFKVEFAQLYSAFGDFQQMFLASSMLSTELWYRHNGTGSLVDEVRMASMSA